MASHLTPCRDDGALPSHRLFDKLRKHILSLLANIHQITVHLSAQPQAGVAYPAVFSDVPQMPLAPNASGKALWNSEVWQEVITLPAVGSANLLKD